MRPHIVSLSRKGIDWLAELEGGYRLKAYDDGTGVWTISAGLTTIRGRRVRPNDTLEIEEAKAFFGSRVAEDELHVDACTRDDISQAQFDALVALSYNIGRQNFKTSTVLRLVNSGAPTIEVGDAFMMWVYADGQRMKGLVRRRRCEALCYMNGEYKTQGEIETA